MEKAALWLVDKMRSVTKVETVLIKHEMPSFQSPPEAVTKVKLLIQMALARCVEQELYHLMISTHALRQNVNCKLKMMKITLVAS